MEVLKGKARNIKKENSLKKKNIKGEYGRNRYHHMSEEKKQRLSKGIPKKLLQCKKKKKILKFFFFFDFFSLQGTNNGTKNFDFGKKYMLKPCLIDV